MDQAQPNKQIRRKQQCKQSDTITADDYRRDHVDKDEHGLQKRCVEWFRKTYKQFIIAAVPNGANRQHFAQTQMLNDEGMLAGFPDLIVSVPAGQFHGLFIEMKTRQKGSKVKDHQAAIHAMLIALGYEVLVPVTFEEFCEQVTAYFKLGEFKQQ